MRNTPKKPLACLLASLLVFNGALSALAAAAHQNTPSTASPQAIPREHLLMHMSNLAADLLATPRQIDASISPPQILLPGTISGPAAEPFTLGPDDHARLNAFIARADAMHPPSSPRPQPGEKTAAAIANQLIIGPASITPMPSHSSEKPSDAGAFGALRCLVETLRHGPDIATMDASQFYDLAEKTHQDLPPSRQANPATATSAQLPDFTPMESPLLLEVKHNAKHNLAGETGVQTLNHLFTYATNVALKKPDNPRPDLEAVYGTNSRLAADLGETPRTKSRSVPELARDIVLQIQRLDGESFAAWLNRKTKRKDLADALDSLNRAIEKINAAGRDIPISPLDVSFAGMEVWKDQLDLFPTFKPQYAARLLAAVAARTLQNLGKTADGATAGLSDSDVPLRKIGAFVLNGRLVFLENFADRVTPNELAAAMLVLRLGMEDYYSGPEIESLMAEITGSAFNQPMEKPELKLLAALSADPSSQAALPAPKKTKKQSLEPPEPDLAPQIPAPVSHSPHSTAKSWGLGRIAARLAQKTALRTILPLITLGAAFSAHFLAENDFAAFWLAFTGLLSSLIGTALSSPAQPEPYNPIPVPFAPNAMEDMSQIIPNWDMNSAVARDLHHGGPREVHIHVDTQDGEIQLGIDTSAGKDNPILYMIFQTNMNYAYPFMLVPDNADLSHADTSTIAFSAFKHRFWAELEESIRSYIARADYEEKIAVEKFFRRFKRALKQIGGDGEARPVS